MRRQALAHIGLDQTRHFRLLGAVIAGDDRPHRIPFKADLGPAQGAGGDVFPFLDRGEGGVQHVKKPPRRVEFQEGRPKRDHQDIGRRQPVDGQIAEGRGGIDEDHVVLVQHPVFFQRFGQRIPQLPAARLHPPDGDLEFGPIEVQLGADQIDVGPMGRPDHILGRHLHRILQRLVQGDGGLSAVEAPLVVGLKVAGIVAGEQGEDGVPFILDLGAEDRRHRPLAVEVHHQHPIAIQRGRHRQMRRGRGLADPALEVGHGDDFRRQAFGPVGQVVLGLRSLRSEEGAQLQHLVEGEPLGAPLGFRGALGQVGVLAQHAAEMRGRDGDQVLGDLPGREGAQTARPVLLQAPLGQVGASGPAGLGNGRKAGGCFGCPQCLLRPIGREVEIRRKAVTAHFALMSHVFLKVRQKAVHATIIGTLPCFPGLSKQGNVVGRGPDTTFCGSLSC